MKNILFLTDLSDHAKNNYLYALHIAQHFNATIHFGHVISVSVPVDVEDDFGTNVIYNQNIEAEIADEFEIDTEKLRTFAEIHTPKESQYLLGDYFVRVGDKVTEILDIITAEKIDLIVMGMQQKNKLANALFGNLAQEIINKSTCPVFLVPQKVVSFESIKNILYAAALKNFDIVVLNRLMAWAEAFDAKLNVLHIIVEQEIEEPLSRMTEVIDEFRQEIAAGKISFKQILKRPVGQEIIQYANELGSDMVVLTRQDRSFWSQMLHPSITRDIIGEVDIPVLVYKSKGNYLF